MYALKLSVSMESDNFKKVFPKMKKVLDTSGKVCYTLDVPREEQKQTKEGHHNDNGNHACYL